MASIVTTRNGVDAVVTFARIRGLKNVTTASPPLTRQSSSHNRSAAFDYLPVILCLASIVTTRNGGDAVVTFPRIRGLILLVLSVSVPVGCFFDFPPRIRGLILGRGRKAVPGLGFESAPRIRGLILEGFQIGSMHAGLRINASN